MKKQTLLLALLTLSAFASKGGGNGGGAIVCTNGEKITSAKLLDLREAELKGLTIDRNNNETVKAQLNSALLKYGKVYPQYIKRIQEELQVLARPGVIQASEKRLAPPTDTGIEELHEPRNCSLEGVAEYYDEESILKKDKVIYENFTNTDKAALLFHEAIYRVYRLDLKGEGNSKNVRKITGQVFASEPLKVVHPKAEIGNALSRCTSKAQKGQNEFYIVQKDDGLNYEAHFTKLNGAQLKEQMILSLGESATERERNNNSYYQKKLEIKRSHEEANGLVTAKGEIYKAKILRKMKLWIGIQDDKYVFNPRYAGTKLTSQNGLETKSLIRTEDIVIKAKGWKNYQLVYNGSVELQIGTGVKVPTVTDAIECKKLY